MRTRLLVWLTIGWLGLCELAQPVSRAQDKKEAVYEGKTLKEWTFQLNDPSAKEREAAAVAIGRFGRDGKPALAAILAVAKDPEPNVRAAAVDALNLLPADPKAVPVLPVALLPALECVAGYLGYQPSKCLAHYYPDGGSRMGSHSDSTDELEPGTGIGVVSLGAERVITFRNRQDKRRLEPYPLLDGSLLFMTAAMQWDWKHANLATDDRVGGRISLTFRRMRVERGTNGSSDLAAGRTPRSATAEKAMA